VQLKQDEPESSEDKKAPAKENLQISGFESDENDDELSFTTLAKKAKATVDVKQTLEEKAKQKDREEKKAAAEADEKKD